MSFSDKVTVPVVKKHLVDYNTKNIVLYKINESACSTDISCVVETWLSTDAPDSEICISNPDLTHLANMMVELLLMLLVTSHS